MTESNFLSLPMTDRKKEFKKWMKMIGRSDSTGRNYVYALSKPINGIIPFNTNDRGILNGLIGDLTKYGRKSPQNFHNVSSSAVKAYINFLDSLSNAAPNSGSQATGSSGSPSTPVAPSFPRNLIVFGTPGCGKSYYVEHTVIPDICGANVADHYIRTTFHPEYSNIDFVGQVRPMSVGNDITFFFHPGPFTRALAAALSCPNQNYVLVIEEINRGNASAIFGDLFQLLDRDQNGNSVYPVANLEIADYLERNNIPFNGMIAIPSNLYIVATMNTSDQNVFKLDNAFKRRWEFKKLKNRFIGHPYGKWLIPGTNRTVSYEKLITEINSYIEEQQGILAAEDKEIGVYFLNSDSLVDPNNRPADEKKLIEKMAEKLFEYLWDDVSKYNRDQWFKKDILSLDSLIEEYEKKGIDVFSDELKKRLVPPISQTISQTPPPSQPSQNQPVSGNSQPGDSTANSTI